MKSILAIYFIFIYNVFIIVILIEWKFIFIIYLAI